MTCLCGQPNCRFVRMLRESQKQLDSMSVLHFRPTLAITRAKERVTVARREYEAHTENPASVGNG